MADSKSKSERKRPWRENIEALTMAIGVALVFKVFFLEISKIPSGSMQPTLMGDPGSETFDRIAVDKLSYHFRDPERWEIVVFKHPLERSRVMVKRLVGMPDEELKIEHGDLWTRASDEEPWTQLRRPQDVQRRMWKSLEPRELKKSRWRALDTEDWRIQSEGIKALGPGSARYERAAGGVVLDVYTDGYPDELRPEVQGGGARHEVGDLRLTGEVVPSAEATAIAIELSEGELRYVFHLPGPAANAEERARIEVRSRNQTAPLAVHEAEGALELVAEEAISFDVQNLDDRLSLRIDGEELVAAEVDPVAQQTSSIVLRLEGGSAEFQDLMPYRDVYYYDPHPTRPKPWTATIPSEHYVMLGDNTQDSADGRDWSYTSFRWDQGDGERSEKGNFRGSGNFGGVVDLSANPIPIRFPDGAAGELFRDEWGDRHWLRESEITARRLDRDGVPMPLVPRGLMMGRAFAVFWPLQPTRGLWRLGWLR